MREMSCKYVACLIEILEDVGLPPNELDEMVDDLPFTTRYLKNKANRISWDDFNTLLERIAKRVGGADPLEAFARVAVARGIGMIGALAGGMISVRPFYLLGAKWFGPTLFSATRGKHEDLPDGKIRQTIEILPGYRDSKLFFRCMRAAIRCAPSRLGLPDAQVAMELQPGRAVYTITPPARSHSGEGLDTRRASESDSRKQFRSTPSRTSSPRNP